MPATRQPQPWAFRAFARHVGAMCRCRRSTPHWRSEALSFTCSIARVATWRPRRQPLFWASPRWTKPNDAGERYLDVELVDVKHVGTDPAEASSMVSRTVERPPWHGIGAKADLGKALGELVEKVATSWYDGQKPPTPSADRDRMNGFSSQRDSGALKVQGASLGRNLGGHRPICTTARFPTLKPCFRPVSRRPQTFYLGNREYDPVRVGYKTASFKKWVFCSTRRSREIPTPAMNFQTHQVPA